MDDNMRKLIVKLARRDDIWILKQWQRDCARVDDYVITEQDVLAVELLTGKMVQVESINGAESDSPRMAYIMEHQVHEFRLRAEELGVQWL